MLEEEELKKLARQFFERPADLFSWAPVMGQLHAWRTPAHASRYEPIRLMNRTVCGIVLTYPSTFFYGPKVETCPVCADIRAEPLVELLRHVSKASASEALEKHSAPA